MYTFLTGNEEKTMFNLPNNISKRERIVRGAIGGLLLIGAIIGLGKVFAVLVGLLLIAEAGLNYCGIVDLIARFKLDGSNNNPPEDKPQA